MAKTFSLRAFIKAYGTPQFRQYPDHVACVLIDEDGEETFLNPGRTGCSVTTSSPSAMKADMLKKVADLRVLEGTSEAGNTVYTLVDKVDFEDNTVTSTKEEWGV